MAQVTRSLIIALLLSVASGPGHAGGAAHAVSFRLWAELSPQQQVALAPITDDWNHMPASQQEKLLKVAKGYAGLSPKQQAVLQARLVAWAHMTPEQRMVARENYKKLLAMPAQSRLRVKQRWAEARGHEMAAPNAESGNRTQ